MCMQTPKYPRNSGRGLAIAAFSCCAAAVGLYLIGQGLNFVIGFGAAARAGAGAPPVGGCIAIFSYPAGLAGFILWLFYLRSLCFALRNSEVAGKVMAVFIGYIVYFAVCVLFAILMVVIFAAAFASLFGRGAPGSAQQVGRTLGGAFIFMLVVYGLLILGGLGMQVWYTLVLQRVRDVVDRYLARL
jgi:hypothetical protein